MTTGAYRKGLTIAVISMLLTLPIHRPSFGHPFKEKFFSSDISHLYKWTDVLERMDQETEIPPLLASVYSGPLNVEVVENVNAAINQYPFFKDSTQWGVSDYWQTPGEFLTNGGGDCEDFVITKYAWLKTLGMKEDNLKIMIVRDRFLNSMHTLLLVSIEGQDLILDNQEQKTRGDIMQMRYDPVFSFNRQAWWIY